MPRKHSALSGVASGRAAAPMELMTLLEGFLDGVVSTEQLTAMLTEARQNGKNGTSATFYKATSGESLPVGETIFVKHVVQQPRLSFREDELFRAAEAPDETVAFWPCRLYEVAGVPVANQRAGRVRGFYALRIKRELDSWRVFGPHGYEIVAFIEAAQALSAEDLRRVGRRFELSDLYREGRASAIEAVWATRLTALEPAGYSASRAVTPSAKAANAHNVRSLAEVAALALCARHRITYGHFATLYDPWESIIPVASLSSRYEESETAIAIRGSH